MVFCRGRDYQIGGSDAPVLHIQLADGVGVGGWLGGARQTLAPWLSGKRMLAVSEDAFGAGCVGQRVAAILAQHGAAPEKLILINLGKAFLPEGTVPQLQHKAGIDAEGIARAVWEAST